MARGKGEGSLHKNSNGLWEVKIELPRDRDGKRRRKVVRRKNKSEAIQVLRELKAELAKTGDLATSSVTLESWSEHWLAERAKKLAPNTVNGYRVAFRDYINPLLGKRKLDKLTPQDIKHLHDVIQETPKDKALRSLSDPPEGTEYLSSTYALLVHNALSGALKMAVREGKLSRNVCELVGRATQTPHHRRSPDTRRSYQAHRIPRHAPRRGTMDNIPSHWCAARRDHRTRGWTRHG